MSVRRRFKALDGRTGRLERAVNLVEDGEARGLKVHRREADQPHPLSSPSPIPIDRATIVAGMRGQDKSEDKGFKFVVGFTLSGALYESRSSPVLVLVSGGATASGGA